jgi:DnaK suppressor protein
MEQKKLKSFREKLLLKKQEILEAYNKNKTYGKEADEEGAQDIADKASNSYTKEFLFSLSNSEREMLQLVDEALVRIGDKSYGVCVVCESEVEKKRLEAVPWAKHCISCQEKQEQGLL